ncbi:acyl-CoA dehydrogenase family protein, partial [Streptomyces sp. NPDC058171]
KTAAFFIVMAVTNPSLPIYQGMSMFLVEADTPGLTIERHFGLGGDPLGEGSHALLRFDGVRVPASNMLGREGDAFAVAQTRLGGGRLHHAMRTVGLCRRAFEMMLERAVSRTAKGARLADMQLVQEQIADAWAALHRFRLQVLHAAWVVDEGGEIEARRVIAGVKFAAPQALQDVVSRCIQIHGALGISNQLPLWEWLRQVHVLNLADGPVEVHKLNLAKSLLKDATPAPTEWPTELVADRLAVVMNRYPEVTSR